MHTTTEKEYLKMQNLSKSCGKFNSIQSYKLTQELTASNTHALTHRITHTHTSIYIYMHAHTLKYKRWISNFQMFPRF